MFRLFTVMLSVGGETLWERISAWYQNSLLNEILTYIEERYFTVEFGSYDNFAISGSAGTTARNAILAMAIGIVVASIMTAYLRNGLGGFVRKLIAEEVNSPENAKTLTELGYFRSSMIRRELVRGSSLRMVVRCRETEACEDAEREGQEIPENAKKTHTGVEKATKIDFCTAHFYIPEDLRYRAELRFDKKGSGWGPVILTSIAVIFVAAALCWFLPDVLQFADNLISMTAP